MGKLHLLQTVRGSFPLPRLTTPYQPLPSGADAAEVPLAHLPVPFLRLSRDSDPRVLEANDAFVRSFGFTVERIPHFSDWLRHAYPLEVYRQRVLDQWQQLADQALTEAGASLQCRVVDAAGERREVQLQVAAHGEQLLVAVIDVTARSRAESELEEARAIQAEMALAITEAIPVGTYTMVMPPDRPVAYFSFMSERFLELTGLDRARARENPLEGFACVHPDDYDEWLRLNAEAFAAKRPFRGETRVVVKGQTRWITAESVPRDLPDGSTVWEGVLTDVTDRVLAQQKLQESERRLQRILDNLPIPVATLSLTEGAEEELFQNRRFLETFGYRRDQIATQAGWFALAYPDLPYRAEVEERWQQAVAEADANGGLVPTGEYRVRCADGRELDVLISGTRLEKLLVVTLLDITERRQAERALAERRRLEKRLEEQRRLRLEQKLRSSLTAAAVAHEINQPLSTILLHARLARQQGLAAQDGKLDGALSSLVSEAERMVTITEKMRSLLRNLQTERVPVDLAAVVESALLYLRPRLDEAGVALQRRGLADPAWIRGDADQLQVAVSNLVRNAIESLTPCPDSRRIGVDLRAAGDRLLLTIDDNGPGFQDGVIQALPLITTKPDGSGIGLYVVHTTAENHSASLHFGRSALGGAAVTLGFELLPPASVPASMEMPLSAL
jgi:PAS domain S-box-containing protein